SGGAGVEEAEPCEQEVEFAAPELVGPAVGEGLGELGDAGEPQRGPRLGAHRRRQSLADEQAANAVLAADAFRDEPFAQADERLPLADGPRRDGDALDLAGGGQPGELEGGVAGGLALDALPLPGGAGGAGDEGREAELFAEIVDPSGLRAGFEDDEGDGLSGEFAVEFLGRRPGGVAVARSSARFVPAQNAVELPEVDGENRGGHDMLLDGESR